MKAALSRQNILVILLIASVVTLISAPVYTYRIMNPTDNDYGTHIQFAIDLLKHKPVPSYTLAHPMMQILLIGLLWITRGKMGLWVGSIVIQVAAQVLTALVLYFWFGSLSGRWSWLWRVFCAVTLTLVAPLMALVPIDGQYYMGYVGLANYHNPTIHLLRPFALVSFILALRVLERPRNPWWMVAASAVIIVLSALIKPNYALCILPALALLVMIRLLWKSPAGQLPVDWRLLLGGFVIPACLVLAVQGVVTYSEGGSIVLRPFVVEASYSAYLPVKYLLSIVFPLAALLAYFPSIRRSPEMLLAWAAFAAGTLQLYLLAESGTRLLDGNFRWGAQISLFVLFAATVRFLLHCAFPPEKQDRKRLWFAAVPYLLHFAAGIIYYQRVFTSNWYG